MDKKEQIKKAIFKVLKTMLIGTVIGVALLLLLALLDTHADKIIVQVVWHFVLVDIIVAFLGVPTYIAYGLIKEFATGTLKKVLYGVWAFFALGIAVSTVIILLPTKTGNGIVSIFSHVITAGITISVLVFLFRKISKAAFTKAVVVRIKKALSDRRISTLKGYHICGLSTYGGKKVSVDLYKDRIVFRSGKSELESIGMEDFVSASFRSEKEIVGSRTVGKQQPGLAYSVMRVSGNYARVYRRGHQTTVYETKNKVEVHWFFVLDTTTTSITLQVKSYSAVYYFVNLCNDTLCYSEADYEEKSAEDYSTVGNEDERIDIDKMDGATFEHFCADLLRVNGWTDVRITPASGDHGIDITAEKDDIKWGFQCKRWGDTKVDAIAIGQTYKGKALYECDMVAVITTSTLTAQAEGEAKQLGIKVWGRGKIRQLMSKLDNADDYYLSA